MDENTIVPASVEGEMLVIRVNAELAKIGRRVVAPEGVRPIQGVCRVMDAADKIVEEVTLTELAQRLNCIRPEEQVFL